MINKHQILLIEDDQPLAELVADFLEQHEFDVTIAEDGQNALTLLANNPIDLILCDVMLPDQDGFSLIKELLSIGQYPVLFMTALSDTRSEINGLDLGASDYLIKPIDPPKLLARVRANLRKVKQPESTDVIKLHDLTLNHSHMTVTYKQQLLPLTNQEFELLWYFASRGDSLVSRETLFIDIIGRDYDGLDRAADLRISRLRKKLETIGATDLRIESIRGKGYIFYFWKTIR